MTVRVFVGTCWSLLTGLAGGWLVLSPWALGEQPSGAGWKTVTSAQVGTGLGLIALAIAGFGLVTIQTLRALREAGMLARPVDPPPPDPEPGEQQAVPVSDVDGALIALAKALAADLNRQQSQAGNNPGAEAPSTAETWRRTDQ